MIKKFEDYTNGYGFLLPSESGSLGYIPKGPVGTKIQNFEEFGEYRKGSDKFGGLVQDLMSFLRIFKNDNEKDILKFEIDDSGYIIYNDVKKGKTTTNLNIKEINDLLKHNTNLLTFDIEIGDNTITFKNLNNVYKSRHPKHEKKVN